MLKLVECPRDAMQGLHDFIPTETKIAYINSLLKVGFDTLDFGSFVSPKAIPQLRDTAEVLAQLDLSATRSKLLAIVANVRGAESACSYSEIKYLGFPFSISETFQRRNTNSTIVASLENVQTMQDLSVEHGKELVIYISMAFGNPYGDPWNPAIAAEYVGKIAAMGIKTIALADTVGVAQPADVSALFSTLIPAFPEVEMGAHLHCTATNWFDKVDAAWQAGCRRFDTAMKGYGGCPMAEDELVGNLATENMLTFLAEKGADPGIEMEAFHKAFAHADAVFSSANTTS